MSGELNDAVQVGAWNKRCHKVGLVMGTPLARNAHVSYESVPLVHKLLLHWQLKNAS